MKNDKMYIKWLELTANLIQKYNFDSLSLKVESHLLGLDTDKVIYKELLKVNIKDENKYIIKNEYYDILNKEKEVNQNEDI